ncbi:MAG: hypothetical protein ACJ76H_15915 [Bacteriovoracaceae bacterium]
MKRQLTVALGLAVIATPALATKARLEALGEDTFGSYYINDNRNIFLNPARINENKDFITYEFGASGQNLTGADTAANPRAGGGFAKSVGNMVYGLHFGDSSPTTGYLRGITGAANGLQEVQPWDFFIGGDAGAKWGASFTYESFDGGTAAAGNRYTSNAMKFRGGVLMGDLDLFAQIALKNKAQDYVGNKVQGDWGSFIGAGYMMNNYKLFLDWRKTDIDYMTGGAAKKSLDTSIWRLGVARSERLNDRATLFAKAMITRTTANDQGTAVFGAKADSTTTLLPVVVGLEYAATSWLDLRGSVVQNVFSQQQIDPSAGAKTSGNVANTAVNAGASLKFGEFSIDGLISTSASGAAPLADNSGTQTTPQGSTTQGAGTLRTDQLMTRVSMIYRF